MLVAARLSAVRQGMGRSQRTGRSGEHRLRAVQQASICAHAGRRCGERAHRWKERAFEWTLLKLPPPPPPPPRSLPPPPSLPNEDIAPAGHDTGQRSPATAALPNQGRWRQGGLRRRAEHGLAPTSRTGSALPQLKLGRGADSVDSVWTARLTRRRATAAADDCARAVRRQVRGPADVTPRQLAPRLFCPAPEWRRATGRCLELPRAAGEPGDIQQRRARGLGLTAPRAARRSIWRPLLLALRCPLLIPPSDLRLLAVVRRWFSSV